MKKIFKLKDWNKEKLKEVFTELEFKTLGKRILGEDFTAFKTAPEGGTNRSVWEYTEQPGKSENLKTESGLKLSDEELPAMRRIGSRRIKISTTPA